MIGVPYDIFWTLNPRTLNVYAEAYKMQIKRQNELMYLNGQYTMYALFATVGNMFKKKGARLNEYPKEPIDIFNERSIVVHDDMTIEEKKRVQENFRRSLERMQEQFERNHKKDRE